MFNDQILCSSFEKHSENHKYQYDVLINEKVTRNDYININIHLLDYLLKNNIVAEVDEHLVIVESELCNLVNELFYKERICYSYCEDDTKKLIDNFIEKNILLLRQHSSQEKSKTTLTISSTIKNLMILLHYEINTYMEGNPLTIKIVLDIIITTF